MQALVTLNDPVYVEAAQALARRMLAAGDSPAARIEYAYHVSLIRDPTPAEVQRLAQLAEVAQVQLQTDQQQANLLATQPLGELPDGADATELAAWTVVGNVILNLDETLMKR